MRLTDDQIELYSRQILLREVGGVGQRRLLDARCLLRGAGIAFETAATYLVGAGLGRLDLSPWTEARSGYASLSDRNPDVVLGEVPAGAIDLSIYDVAIEASAPPRSIQGFARHGEISVRTREREVEVLVVPSHGGCLACCAPEAPLRPPSSLLEAAQAGALAALAALGWLAGVREDPRPRSYVLSMGRPTWAERSLGPTATCPRPCRR